MDEWLQIACNRLRYHPILVSPKTDVARQAKTTCEQYVWAGNLPSISQPSITSSPPQVEQPTASITSDRSEPSPTSSQSPNILTGSTSSLFELQHDFLHLQVVLDKPLLGSKPS
jgi:hypothetical protein